ncbi:MAG: bifunctional diaminohydroxyphosphoribosylaminopyrimidine deaminase/5-amino-6-(5-phosphoribosylamino)uracil reductase RibD [Pseudomonadota bacterium]
MGSAPPQSDTDDIRWMRHALALAARGLGRTWPNPSVGCVIVKDGRLLARAVTAAGGRPHAEQRALAEVGDAARGATLYVTLEPCAHVGLTPSCARLIVEAGLARVVSALEDPDPRVAGKGYAILENGGIALRRGVQEEAAAALQAGYLKRRQTGLPLVTLKLATSLDGRIATQTGESQWITGPMARARGHLLRAQHDLVLVGSGTALADNPRLTVRLPGMAGGAPVRAVMDSTLRLPAGSALFEPSQPGPVWVLHAPDATSAARDEFATRAELIEVARHPEGGLDPVSALEALSQRGITRVLCEGGGQLGAALLRDRLVDRIAHFSAGILLGDESHAGIGPLGLDRLSTAPRFRLVSTERLGPDTFSEWHAVAETRA